MLEMQGMAGRQYTLVLEVRDAKPGRLPPQSIYRIEDRNKQGARGIQAIAKAKLAAMASVTDGRFRLRTVTQEANLAA